MERISRTAVLGFIALLTLALFVAPTQADGFTESYCSTQNTADGDAQYWEWQSNGWCTNSCKGSGTFAFAVIQGNNCWCSNYIPAQQSDQGDCNVDCPGFPSEKCGSADKGVFIYIQLNGQPSGTKGAAPQPTSAQVSSSSAAPPPSSTEAAPSTPSSAPPSPVSSVKETVRNTETVVQTITAKPSVVTLTPTPTPTPTPAEKSSAPPASSTPTTLKTSASNAESSPIPISEPQTSVLVVTESGRIITQTVINMPTEAPVQTGETKKGSNTGAIVGGVVGGLAGLAAIVGGVFFLLRRRRQQQQRLEEEGQSGVQRNTSTMSKSGLLRTEKEPQYPPRIATTFSSRHSRTLDNESISPISGSDRRSSRPFIFDQRLNPSAIMMNLDNTSRGSFGSMDDSHDYGRTLNIRNPDLDGDRH